MKLEKFFNGLAINGGLFFVVGFKKIFRGRKVLRGAEKFFRGQKVLRGAVKFFRGQKILCAAEKIFSRAKSSS